ncbi:DUF2785 domain-containing protein [Arenimonas sp.]|uniref:DUF2785 domain-containing protein n=1 Tax=Arenimonas sp. TaxID=1872635 RepID=UPI0039E38887
MRLSIRTSLLALALLAAAGSASADCPPPGWTKEKLLELKANKFAVEDFAARSSLAVDLLACLSSPDPQLRDGIAFEAETSWLRSGQFDHATRQAILQALLPKLRKDASDREGFTAPFAALVLAEVARTDRLSAWMTTEQRTELVTAAAEFLEGVNDYRGFDAKEGWRHGVAHGADLAMQLALNPQLDRAQLDRLLAAVRKQIAPAGEHFYIYGESERLLRPMLFIAQRGLHDEAFWKAWLTDLIAPAPLPSWDSAFSSQAGLAKRHNTQAFLLALYANTRDSEQPVMQSLAGSTREALQALP